MGSRVAQEQRCRTCNHKQGKHFWSDESAVSYHGVRRPNGFCMKPDCRCEQYKMQPRDIERTFTFAVCLLITVSLVLYMLSSMHVFG